MTKLLGSSNILNNLHHNDMYLKTMIFSNPVEKSNLKKIKKNFNFVSSNVSINLIFINVENYSVRYQSKENKGKYMRDLFDHFLTTIHRDVYMYAFINV